MKIEINCSQELLEKSKYCGTGLGGAKYDVVSKCWVALAIRGVFHNARVGNCYITIEFKKIGNAVAQILELELPESARIQVRDFDRLRYFDYSPEKTAELRLKKLKPFTFEIELTEEQVGVLLENIALPDLTECFAKSRHLTLTV